jgi:hypothetical protein
MRKDYGGCSPFHYLAGAMRTRPDIAKEYIFRVRKIHGDDAVATLVGDTDQYGRTPLHHLFTDSLKSDTGKDLRKMAVLLLHYAPDSSRQIETLSDCLPIHSLCNWKEIDLECLHMLLTVYPESATIRSGSAGRTPLEQIWAEAESAWKRVKKFEAGLSDTTSWNTYSDDVPSRIELNAHKARLVACIAAAAHGDSCPSGTSFDVVASVEKLIRDETIEKDRFINLVLFLSEPVNSGNDKASESNCPKRKRT